MSDDLDENVEGEELKTPLDDDAFEEVELGEETLEPLDPFAPEEEETDSF